MALEEADEPDLEKITSKGRKYDEHRENHQLATSLPASTNSSFQLATIYRLMP